MNYWLEEMKSILEKKRSIYRSPLSKKKQRTSARGRSNKAKVYSAEEIKQYWNQQLMRREV